MERTFLRRMDDLQGIFAFIEEFLAAQGLDSKHGFNLGLVAEELFTNMVRHSRGGTPEIVMGLARRGPDAVLTLTETDVEIWDPTTSAPPVDPEAPLEKRRPGGLGIHFVIKLAKDFSYEHKEGKSTVTAVLGLEGSDV
jgi:anti-sigma regulatory factor (Ser/Thr protein kinase)